MDYFQDYPVSQGQQQLWYLQRRLPEDSRYNIGWGIRIADKFDPIRARIVISKLEKRYPLMRAVFPEKFGKPVCRIQPQDFISWEVVDAKMYDKDQLEANIKGWHRTPFCLEMGPLVRFRLYAHGDEFILVVSMHHIISDGISVCNLIEAFGRFYEVPTLSDILIDKRFFDHVFEENEFLKSEDAQRRLQYYVNLVKGSNFMENFQYRDDIVEKPSSHSGYHFFMCAPMLTKLLKNMAFENKVSLYTVLLATYGIFTMRCNGGQNGFLTAIATAGRTRQELKSFGFFSDLALIQHRASLNETIASVLSDISGQVKYVNENHYPFSSLVDYFHRHHSEFANFAVKTTFVCQRLPKNQPVIELPSETENECREWHGLRLKPFVTIQQEILFDFGVEVVERETDIGFLFKFRADLWTPATVERMAQRYLTFLANLVEQPCRMIRDIELLPKSELSQIARFESPQIIFKRDPSQNLINAFSEISRRFPDRIAVSMGETTITYRELDRESNQLAHLLVENGVRPGERVQLLLKRSPCLIVAMLATLKTGATYIPTDPDSPSTRVVFIAEDSEAAVILTEESLASELEANCPVIVLDSPETILTIANQRVSTPAILIQPDDTAYVIYTSGSTGIPKGVMVSHFNVLRLFKSTECLFDFAENDVWSLYHSFAFDFSVWEIFGALLYGGRIAIVPYCVSRDFQSFHRFLQQEGVTVLNQTPSAFAQLIAADAQSPVPIDFKLRYIIFGGEALNLSSIAPWVSRYGDCQPRLVNMYGITETTVHVTYRTLTQRDIEESKASLIGRAIPDLGIRIVDPNTGAPLGIGMPGEIWITGGGVSKGYLNRPELTAQRFICAENGETFYRSGDLAYWLPNGEIAYLGRIDTQVKIRGFRIELGEIESILCNYPKVEWACVLVTESDSGKRLVACIASDSDPESLKSELISYVRTRLPNYMWPAAWLIMKTLPLNVNGKVDRDRLLSLFEQQVPVSPHAGAGSGNLLEQALGRIWCVILNSPSVDIHENFFDIGGDSLSIAQVYDAIVAEGLCFPDQLSITDLFNYPTIAQCAELLSTRGDLTAAVDVAAPSINTRRMHLREQGQRRSRAVQYLENEE